MKKKLTVTSPEAYAEKARHANAAEEQGFLHQLKKTGAVVRLRRVDMEALAVVGALPMSLVAAAMKGEEESSDGPAKTKTAPSAEEIERGNNTLIFMRQMVVENCMEPSIRYVEGVGVFFVNTAGDLVTRVDKDDFMEMFAIISGEEGADGLDSFRNRKERRASASKPGRKALRNEALSPVERVIADS